MEFGKAARRLVVISDLHLGGTTPSMMSHPTDLADFLRRLPSSLLPDEAPELVIAGDFVDFLAISPQASWTPDPTEARQKLEQTMTHPSPFAEIFDALGELVAQDYRLTVMVGNHDVEMSLPPVQDAFLRRIGATPHQVLFSDDGRAHKIGRALIEHGNRYDDANRNDWTHLRAIASAMSRGEKPEDELEVTAGSRIVERVVNQLKSDYPFIDLLQPQGELVAWLMFAFEPKLMFHLDKIAWIVRGKILEERNKRGLQPGDTRYVAYQGSDEDDPELASVFGDSYKALRSPSHPVGWQEWISIWPAPGNDGIAAILERGDSIPADQLKKIRLAMTKLLLKDESGKLDGDTQQYGKAAKRIIRDSKGEIEVVVMGHTHLARHIGDPERASYINTGTWADVVRVKGEDLAEGAERKLEGFLRSLKHGRERQFVPTYADLRVEADGRVSSAQLLPVGK